MPVQHIEYRNNAPLSFDIANKFRRHDDTPCLFLRQRQRRRTR